MVVSGLSFWVETRAAGRKIHVFSTLAFEPEAVLAVS
jgi:hypothetical protein